MQICWSECSSTPTIPLGSTENPRMFCPPVHGFPLFMDGCHIYLHDASLPHLQNAPLPLFRLVQVTLSISTEPHPVIPTEHFPLSFLSPYLSASRFRPSLPLLFRPSHLLVCPCHFFRWRSSASRLRPSGASGEIWYVVRGTVVGIYGLRRLQRRRCGELDPEGLSSRLAVARTSPQMSTLNF